MEHRIIMIKITNDRHGSSWLPNRGKAQMTFNSKLPHEDNILNQFRIRKERHIRMRKPPSTQRGADSAERTAPSAQR